MFCNPLINTTNSNVYIQVSNRGAFVAYFNLIYYVNGTFNTVNSYQLAALQSDKIILPHNATNIHLTIYYAIQFSTWFLVYDKYFSYPIKKCYVLYGTVWNPSCTEIFCPNNTISSSSSCNCCNYNLYC